MISAGTYINLYTYFTIYNANILMEMLVYVIINI